MLNREMHREVLLWCAFVLVGWGSGYAYCGRFSVAAQCSLTTPCNRYELKAARVFAAAASRDDDPELRKVNGMKGYYVRPSRAIEKGGGFFIPGFEGGKIRILSAALLLGLFVINSLGLQQPSLPVSISTVTGVTITVLLLWQGIASFLPTSSSVSEGSIEADMYSYMRVIQRRDNLPKSILASCEALLQNIPHIRYLAVLDSEPSSIDNEPMVKLRGVMCEWGLVNQQLSSLDSERNASVTFTPAHEEVEVLSLDELQQQHSGWALNLDRGDIKQILRIYSKDNGLVWVLALDEEITNPYGIITSNDAQFLLSLSGLPIQKI